MQENKKPVEPVRPSSIELVYIYDCPFCGHQTPLVSPTQPSMVQCETCKSHFPIVPVDEKTVHFMKIILANGRAGIDPDFL